MTVTNGTHSQLANPCIENAKSFYGISANPGYPWTNEIATLVGYRQFHLDYDQNDFQYDAKQTGLN
jgi:hypothetical protein